MAILDGIRRFVADRLTGDQSAEARAAGGPTPVQLAACALLLELAHADGEFSAEEQAHLRRALREQFGLEDATAAELLRLADTARTESLDHFQFTRLIAAEYDLPRKMELAMTMWGVILADGRLSDHETHLVRKMASLMQLDPVALAAARRAAEASLSGGSA
ncbi:MAG: TerB family tellurite resistance protein [Gemmatimonadales bacterium]